MIFEILVYGLMVAVIVLIFVEALGRFIAALGDVLLIRAGRWQWENEKKKGEGNGGPYA